MRKSNMNKEEIAEDYCFTCKDGGHLRVCDFKNCLKAYHPECVGRDPSFLETDEQWNCGWHSCFICKKSSSFQCFCCTSSVCRRCIREAEFVQVKKKTKGFCSNCLKLALLIEENVDADSDGGKVDFKDSETYEFLFKDYWELVKEKEGLSILHLRAADALLKRGENYKHESDSDKLPEEDPMSEDDLEDNCDDEISFLVDLKVKQRRTKTPIKRFRSKKKTYVGWGSEELIKFLSSIGKDITEPLSQLDACEIVKDYIQANNLLHPDKKKKHVACDEKLHSLFRKKKLKLHKIYSLLENHFAANDDSDDDISFSSEENDNSAARKKKQNMSSEHKVLKSHPYYYRDKALEPTKSCYASIVLENIKLVYLKRSLIVDLLKYPETFEEKVVGCFVRVKNDPKDFYNIPQNLYQLGRVSSIKKASEAYKMGESSTDVILCVSNMWKDIQITMLSDDDIEEEECEELRQLVQKGLFRRPTVAELEEKVRTVHEDLTNHWIDRELVKLQRLIDRANEKGWRRELFDYIDKRELLRTSSERQRLLKEIPRVLADISDIIDTTSSVKDSRQENKENWSSFHENGAKENHEESEPHDSSALNKNSSNCQVIEIDEDEEDPKGNKTGETLFIDLVEDEVYSNTLQEKKQPMVDTHEKSLEEVIPDSQNVWHYIDPQGNEQGPFAMKLLRRWREEGFFDDNFKVWRIGQSRENAILLNDAIRLTL
ncbi:uncharacterized protein At5g08430-like isoform X2 [Typha latifolia]|uniref:uncharacterized protein At5g08430-like isoform X2 n=1 Tax=Typha latifolia TaxID=4733 RepID=UPI003C2F24C3